MSVSIYLSSQIIQVAVGTRAKKGSLKTVYTAMAPEGSIINGIVMDSDSLGGFLKNFWEEHKLPKNDVYLVVNSNKIAGKNVEAPNMNPKKTKEFILREFADMSRDSDTHTMAYIPVGFDKETKLRHLYAESAPKDQLKEFMEIFAGMGIKLKGIVSGESSIIGYAQSKLAKAYNTFVLQISSGNVVFNLLFVNGMFKYFNSVRCFNEPGTEGYFEDMARSLNQLYQFMQAQRINSPIERVFLAGIDREDLGYYGQTIRDQGTDVTCEMVDTGFGSGTGLQYESGNALFAVSGLFDQGPDSNFLTNFSMKKSADSAFDNRIKKYVLLIAAVFVVMFVVFLVTLGMRLVRSAKLKELQDYNDTVAPQAMFYDMEALRRDELSAKYNSINSVVQTIESYPVGSDEVISILERTAQGYAQIKVSSFDADAGKISFTATSQNVNDIYKYIDRLLEEDIFQSVEHTGYTYDSSKDCYNIYVDCTLAESAGRKLKEEK